MERPDPDQPIKRIEIRLERNITEPMLIGIQEVAQQVPNSNDEDGFRFSLESESLLPVQNDEKPKVEEKRPATLSITVKRAASSDLDNSDVEQWQSSADRGYSEGTVDQTANLPTFEGENDLTEVPERLISFVPSKKLSDFNCKAIVMTRYPSISERCRKLLKVEFSRRTRQLAWNFLWKDALKTKTN